MEPFQSKASPDLSRPAANSTSRHHSRRFPKELPPDIIDIMDDSLPPALMRHHGGPFDAVAKSAYLSENKSPLAALERSTKETLKATPTISIRDSLDKHIPLQNTAIVPPGEPVPAGLSGEVLDYKEENLLGDVGRWQGIDYDDDDRRAKGHAGWDGAFVNRGRNEADRARYEGKHHPKKGAWGQPINGVAYIEDDGNVIELVPQENDIRVDGMKAGVSAVEEAERHKHFGIVDGIKRRLSRRRSK